MPHRTENCGKSTLRDDVEKASLPCEQTLQNAGRVWRGYAVHPPLWGAEIKKHTSEKQLSEQLFSFTGNFTDAGLGDKGPDAAFELAVGLEIHCALSTATKLFCGCKNAFGAPPNSLCCPVCAGLPGEERPALNARAVEYAVLMGSALHCTVNLHSAFERKHYSYPDLPKGYQITQHAAPLCENGWLDFVPPAGAPGQGENAAGAMQNRGLPAAPGGGPPTAEARGAAGTAPLRRVAITQLHLEEDAGKLIHRPALDAVLADYNRCGVPLIEIVTAPQLRSAGEARAALMEVARLLRCLGVGEAKMQEGGLRADVNLSLRVCGQAEFGIRTELKNLGNFGAVYRAVRWEAARQAAVLRSGRAVEQLTLRWDDEAGAAFPMRGKEAAAGYRFTAEDALPPLVLAQQDVDAIKGTLPELPAEKYSRYARACGLSPQQAHLLSEEPGRAAFFDAALACGHAPAKALAGWLLGEAARLLNRRRRTLAETALSPGGFAALVSLVSSGTLSYSAGKALLARLFDTAVPLREIPALARRLGLDESRGEAALTGLVRGVLAENPKPAADYRAGKAAALKYLLGQCMKTGGAGESPEKLRALLQRELSCNDGGGEGRT